MKIEHFTHPKDRNGSIPGDDAMVIEPSLLFGIFDGASDATGLLIDGRSPGLFAAETVASAALSLARAGQLQLLPTDDIITQLNRALSDALMTNACNTTRRPCTTAALALPTGDGFRLIVLGDSGIRINGDEVLETPVTPDIPSTAARISLFNQLLARGRSHQDSNQICENVLWKGMALAQSNGIISSVLASQMTADAVDAMYKYAVEIAGYPASNLTLDQVRLEVEMFLQDGIVCQPRYANASSASILRYPILNGITVPSGAAIDRTVKLSELTSLELFSDGYGPAPDDIGISAWEANYHKMIERDPYCLDGLASTKGSSETSFFDDRSLICLSEFPNSATA
ncbi:hypothetical protein [Aliiroseovarius sp. 2305UL8-7]|uniref:hypothetical protein n=1 Tax=Aliiroseovarius conchicola TaxID=3121637 RepID=UPI003527F674